MLSGAFARIRDFIHVTTILLLTSGCAVGPDYRTPEVPLPSMLGKEVSDVSRSELATAEWWKSLRDPTLDSLIERAIRNNRDVDAALGRLREARAAYSEARLDLFPTVRALTQYQRQRSALGGFGSTVATPLPAGFDRTSEFYQAGFDASWEIDIFGRVRRSVEASAAEEEAVSEELKDVLVSVIAEVVRNYIELRGAQRRLAVARKSSSNQRSSLELTTTLMESGRATGLDSSRAEAQLETTRSTIPPLDAASKSSIFRIAVLCGEAPRTLLPDLSVAKPLPRIPRFPEVGAPAALVRRRPDVGAAERRLASATAGIGIATADLYPRFDVFGSLGVRASVPSALADGGNDFYSFGPRLSWAAFDLGRVRARIRGASARAEQRFSQFELAVLVALEEVERAVANLEAETARSSHLRKAERSSIEASSLARTQYEDGIADFLQVLDAQRVELQAADILAQSETQRLLAFVALYKALGGGWEGYRVMPAGS